jgi:hypothetical protein
MNRRQFLSSTALGTVLGGIALAALARPAKALTAFECSDNPGGACTELQRHDALLAEIDAMLAEKGLNEEQRREVLAKTMCPFCGLPLLG